MSDHEEVEMEDQVEEPKKGRGGRPKKAAIKTKAEEKSSDEPQVKRGRGRPPKAEKDKAKPAPKAKKPTADAGNDSEDAAEAAPKRRGRAPKAASKPKPESESEQEDNASEEEEPAPPVKAKNGKVGGKKAGKNAAKNGHAEPEEDADPEDDKSDSASGDSRIKIVVEHCKSCKTYRQKAEGIISALREKWSGIEVEYNPMTKPRRESFEINLINNDGKEVPLWTGLELGPPRKLKFPDPQTVVEVMEKVYVPATA